MDTEDEIADQMNTSKPVQIDPEGGIVELGETSTGPDGQVVDAQGRPVTRIKDRRWAI